MNVIKNTLSNVGVFFLLSIKEVYITLESPLNITLLITCQVFCVRE